MEKQRTHLTPEEVLEFISLGVDFGETMMVHRRATNGYGEQCWGKGWSLTIREEHLRQVRAWDRDLRSSEYIPCPNLQEVLEVLPKHFVRWNQTNRCYDNFYLKIKPFKEGDYGVGYNSHIFRERSLLVASIGLLRWVCNNRPETLTKTE